MVVGLDGVGGFDHVKRARLLMKLVSVPELRSLLPLVGMLYGETSHFFWRDDNGAAHVVEQAEGEDPACWVHAQNEHQSTLIQLLIQSDLQLGALCGPPLCFSSSLGWPSSAFSFLQ